MANGNTIEGNGRTGVVKNIPCDKETGLRKGFGFIADTVNGGEYFFHATDVEKGTDFSTLPVGQRVQYRVGEDKGKGPRAAGVRAI